MTPEPGTYALGPQTGTLTVQTGRAGAIARVGHDLQIEVTAWGATVEIASEPVQAVLELQADSNSLRVREGTGGIQSLGEDDKPGINQTIAKEVLKGTEITFRSRIVEPADDGRFHVTGDLRLAGAVNPVTFELTIAADGHLAGSATVKQSAWGMTPYTTLFGTLKVADEVVVSIDATLQSR